MHRLSPGEMRRAETMLAGGALLRSIGEQLGQPFEAVVLGLFGGGAAWVPPHEVPAPDGDQVELVHRAVQGLVDRLNEREPQPSTPAAQMRGDALSASSEDVALLTSPAGAEGIANRQPIQPAGSAAPRFRLVNEIGEYLHRSGHGMTRDLALAWTGTNEQLEAALKRHQHLKDLDVLPAPAAREAAE